MASWLDAAERPRAEQRRWLVVLLLNATIASLALVALALTVAAVMAPSLDLPIDPSAVSSDGGQAFTVSPGFSTHWPYMVPSHPRSVLAPDDVRVIENGQRIGLLEPAHAVIREKGGGLYNLWESTLWFSSSDETDPRDNGRDYRVEVRTRLDPSARRLRDVSLIAFLVLLAWKVGPAASRRLAEAGRALEDRLGLVRLARGVPLTFGRAFAFASAVAIVGFAGLTLAHPMPLVMEIDSLGYVRPGLVWAAGGDLTGQSARDLGYPWLTLMAVRLGSLAVLPKLQLLMVTVALACLADVLYCAAAGLVRRLGSGPGLAAWLVAASAVVASIALVTLLSAHDLFVLNIDSAMAEAPHFLPLALALALLVRGCIARRPVVCLALLVLASLAAYASVMFKPHSLLVLALCLASVLVAGLRHWRALRSPALLVLCVLVAATATVIHRFDALVTPPGNDFGPKTLFCNHLDVIGPVLNGDTPERRRIQELIGEVLGRPTTWPVMGFDGDACMYGASFTAALLAAAGSEGKTPGQFEQREFVKAVIRNPIGYGRTVARQFWAYLKDPANGIDAAVANGLMEEDWQGLAAFDDLMRVEHGSTDAPLRNWLPGAHPRFASAVKTALRGISDVFAPVTLGSTLLAMVAWLRLRRRAVDRTPETVLALTALFTLSFVMTTVLAHTFDIARYATDILPFSLLWWLLGACYLADLAVRAGIAARAWLGREPSLGPESGPATPVRLQRNRIACVTRP